MTITVYVGMENNGYGQASVVGVYGSEEEARKNYRVDWVESFEMTMALTGTGT